MPQLTRITRDPAVMGGKPCIRACASPSARLLALSLLATRVTRSSARTRTLEAKDIAEALSYAAWRAEEVEVPLREP